MNSMFAMWTSAMLALGGPVLSIRRFGHQRTHRAGHAAGAQAVFRSGYKGDCDGSRFERRPATEMVPLTSPMKQTDESWLRL